MTRKIKETMPLTELRAILRAADDLIAEGGRTLLSKILKGSKERKLLELQLDQNPSYGFYKALTLEKIIEKIDEVIDEGYLRTEGDRKFPVLAFTPLGWMIERERRAEEFLQEWNRFLEQNVTPVNMEYLKERNRALVFLFLFKVLCTGDKKYIPLLKMWHKDAFKKVQAQIELVIEALQQFEHMDEEQWLRTIGERAESLLIRSRDPILLDCSHCNNYYLLDELDPRHYTTAGVRIPERCYRCEDKLVRR